MALNALFETLQASPVGTAVAQSTWMFPTLETAHVLALVVVVGTIMIVDLRLLGAASRDLRVTVLSRQFLPWTWGAFAFAVLTGTLLFLSRAADYAVLPQFLAKFVVLGLAGVNMAAFHLVTWRKVAVWDMGRTPVGAKIAGGLSLAFWASIVVLGRQVGFHL